MQEVYFSGDVRKETYAYDSQPDELYATLQAEFPWARKEDYFSISIPSYHDILDEEVVTCCLPLQQTHELIGLKAALTARKFCMQSKTSFLRSYELYEGERPAWLPEGANLLGWGVNHEEYGRPFPEKARTFVDWYFGGDPALMESAFNLPEKRGAYETWYGATTVNGEVVRVKQYCYSEQNTFSDWDVGYMVLCKKLGRTDLLEA